MASAGKRRGRSRHWRPQCDHAPTCPIVSSSRSSLILPSLPKWRPAIAAQRLSLSPIFDGALFDDEACAFEPARSRYGPCSNALPSQRISPNYRKKGWRGLARHPPRPTPLRRRRRMPVADSVTAGIAPLLVRRCRAEARRSACPRSTSPETTACACPPCAPPRSACGRLRGLRPICR